MRIKPVRQALAGRVQLLQHGPEDVLEIQVGVIVDDAFVAQLGHMLRSAETPETYRRRPHSYQEAARLLGVSAKFLQRRVRTGRIPYTLVGAYVRFTGDDIDEIRARMRRGPRRTYLVDR